MKVTKQPESSTWAVYEIVLKVRYIGSQPYGRSIGKGVIETLARANMLAEVIKDKKLVVGLPDPPLFKIGE